MDVDNDWGRGVQTSFKEWAAQVYDASILKTIITDYLLALRSELLEALGRIDDELRKREHTPS